MNHHDTISFLSGMFTNTNPGVIESTLKECNYDVDATTSKLLAIQRLPSKPAVSTPFMPESLNTICQRVCQMSRNSEATRLAQKYGLAIQNVSWEDCGRSKNSSWGPCISDMTLQVQNHRLPVIRYPNFSDLTWDTPMDQIQLTVGNEKGDGALRSVPLSYYLSHFNEFLSAHANTSRVCCSMLASSHDSHVVTSAQACFLPIASGSETEFNVALYNYQSRPGHPAVLSIVSSRAGTSAQVIENGTQKLFFNQKGQKASFAGQRLKDNRAERGVATEGAMTREEKEQNVIMILQVPLKHPVAPPRKPVYCLAKSASMAVPLRRSSCIAPTSARAVSNVDEAIIRVAETTTGPFNELGTSADPLLERDERFPIRLTLQFYKATDNGVVNDDDVSHVASQLRDARRLADFVGSLVVDGNTNRPTEHHHVPVRPPCSVTPMLPPPRVIRPPVPM